MRYFSILHYFCNMNIMLKLKPFLLIIFFLCCLISCERTSSKINENNDIVTLYDAGEDKKDLELPTQLWHVSDEIICVLYGYGYNDDSFVKEMNEALFFKYGNYMDGGLIYPLVFPNDFKRGTKNYISFLYDYLADMNVRGIVMLGAPDGTHFALAKLQDRFNGKIPYPVISLFSQDDVLAMEYSSDFVLDKAQKAEINGLIQNEEGQDFVKEVPDILSECVKCINLSDAPFEKNAELYEIVKKVAVNKRTGRYSDPETGLISINHFVLE